MSNAFDHRKYRVGWLDEMRSLLSKELGREVCGTFNVQQATKLPHVLRKMANGRDAVTFNFLFWCGFEDSRILCTLRVVCSFGCEQTTPVGIEAVIWEEPLSKVSREVFGRIDDRLAQSWMVGVNNRRPRTLTSFMKYIAPCVSKRCRDLDGVAPAIFIAESVR